MVDAAEQPEQVERVDAAAVGDAVLAVGREDVVLGTQRPAGADLRGLLAEELGPDAELAVPLQRGGLGVDPPGEDHVAVEAAQLLRTEVEVELGVVDALALGRQQLDQLGAAVGLRGAEDLDEVRTEIGHSTLPVSGRLRGLRVAWHAVGLEVAGVARSGDSMGRNTL